MLDKVSVIVTVYDRNELIDACLNSVATQSIGDIEIICIDGSGNKKGYECLRRWQEKDKRIRIQDGEYATVSEARNAAVCSAAGKYVCFMYSDDFYVQNNALEMLVNACEANNTMLAGASMEELHAGSDDVKTVFEGVYKGKSFDKDEVRSLVQYQYDYGYSRFAYNRCFLIDNNIFFPPYEYMAENVFMVRAMTCAGRFACISRILYADRIGYRPVTWTDRVANDILRALSDNLRMAAEYSLEDLKNLTINRILREYVFIIKDHTIPSNPKMLEIMAELERIPYGSLEDTNFKLEGIPEGDERILSSHIYKSITSVILGMILEHKSCIEYDLNREKEQIIHQNSILAGDFDRACGERDELKRTVARLNAQMKLYDNRTDDTEARIHSMEETIDKQKDEIELLAKRGRSASFYIGRIFTFIPETIYSCLARTKLASVKKKDVIYWLLVVYITYFIYRLAF